LQPLNEGDRVLVANPGREALCLRDPISNHLQGREPSHQPFGLVDFHDGLKILGNAVPEFLDSVYPGFLQQVGLLLSYALDVHQIRRVYPFQDQLMTDACLFLQLPPPLGRGVGPQQRLHSANPLLSQLLSIDGADPFYDLEVCRSLLLS